MFDLFLHVCFSLKELYFFQMKWENILIKV